MTTHGDMHRRERRVTVPRPVRPASAWMWLTGFLCLSVAAVLFLGGLKSYLTPLVGQGPSLHTPVPLTVQALGVIAFLVHCLSLLGLGAAGAAIVHRAWHPTKVWVGRPEDPPFVHQAFRLYNWLSLHALSVAWRATYVTALLCLFGLLYSLSGEGLRLQFQVGPDSEIADRMCWLALVLWPALFLCLSNTYSVKQHFLAMGTPMNELVRPEDVADLVHVSDARSGGTDAPARDLPLKERFRTAVAAAVRFLQVRTCALRHRVVEIGHTDVNARWWSQQFLRAYRWGPDHRMSESQAWSFAVHGTVLLGPIVLASIAGFASCRTPVDPPPSGPPRKPTVRAHPVRVVVNRPKILINPYARYIIVLTIPPETMDDPEERERLEHPYKGPPGKGIVPGNGVVTGIGPGKKGGAARFFRLKHNGDDWNRNSGHGLDGDGIDRGSDCQMLKRLHEWTGTPVAGKPEFVTADEIRRFPKDRSPSFVYVTGRKPFSVSSREAGILREYILERGGMLIGDSPGDAFSHSFRGMVHSILGNTGPWVEIPNDDEIFRGCYYLENGAPPLWHHDGYRALGIKHQGRWVVFYHPGDMGDAWKVGHAGASQDTIEAAYQMGVNLFEYSIQKQADFHRGRY